VENIRLKKIGTQDEIANDPGIGRNFVLDIKGLIQGKNRGGGMSNGANPTDPLSYLRGISGIPPATMLTLWGIFPPKMASISCVFRLTSRARR